MMQALAIVASTMTSVCHAFGPTTVDTMNLLALPPAANNPASECLGPPYLLVSRHGNKDASVEENSILKLSRDGCVLSEAAVEQGYLRDPRGMVVLPNGNLLVASASETVMDDSAPPPRLFCPPPLAPLADGPEH